LLAIELVDKTRSESKSGPPVRRTYVDDPGMHLRLQLKDNTSGSE